MALVVRLPGEHTKWSLVRSVTACSICVVHNTAAGKQSGCQKLGVWMQHEEIGSAELQQKTRRINSEARHQRRADAPYGILRQGSRPRLRYCQEGTQRGAGLH